MNWVQSRLSVRLLGAAPPKRHSQPSPARPAAAAGVSEGGALEPPPQPASSEGPPGACTPIFHPFPFTFMFVRGLMLPVSPKP